MNPTRTARVMNTLGRVPWLQHVGTGLHARAVASSRGRFGRRFLGNPVSVLETTGRHSGRRRRTPLIYPPNGQCFVVTAAGGGADRTPDWWLNLGEHPNAAKIVDRRRISVRTNTIHSADRDDLWRHYGTACPR